MGLSNGTHVTIGPACSLSLPLVVFCHSKKTSTQYFLLIDWTFAVGKRALVFTITSTNHTCIDRTSASNSMTFFLDSTNRRFELKPLLFN